MTNDESKQTENKCELITVETPEKPRDSISYD
jgi:hypothetical protein